MAHPNASLAAFEQLWQQHHWPELVKAQLSYPDIAPVLEQLAQQPAVTQQVIGQSYLGTPIHRLSIGHGPIVVLAWTQMHGDESTATAAVLDWLQLLAQDHVGDLPKQWQSLLTLHVIPMLNPDGAARGTRENAQAIDINRDAMAQQSPEGRLLADQVKTLTPTLAFNLHDQNPYYAAGQDGEPATIAFLAPAYHPDKHVDAARLKAKQLIACMAQALSYWLPEAVGRYDDTYSERSFGDAIAGLGASTILIESGAHRHDPYRQIARRMNVMALQAGLSAWLSGVYQSYSLADYYAIPDNVSDGYVDVMIHQLTFDDGQHQPFTADVGIVAQDQGYYVDFVGDARGQRGLTEYDGTALTYRQPLKLGAAADELLTLVGGAVLLDRNW
ncbi:peptidase M14 [Pseudidiomarina sediminum]|uniref:Peptidase M14 n=1 Tax=Pseudidiomarina sediminum TaxID=431675 RepID=A0A432ZAB7_9GAMM|nr:M14 family zinc carboxypeptidase [Pseudidiomarina sediminum]RUO74885.1 peptidase M14 [Pseudidiomarina sediminum]